ncbi:MAG: hypothetical protein P4L35_20055 [Ignavibacteriaceae bacterium]|nr:hypothetical protein [Ignavibacteriaceae bacterium]
MARIKNQILGDVSGSLGHVVYKIIGNTPYVAKRPNSFIPGTDPASVFRRDQGAFIGKLSSKIYSIGIIKKLWSYSVKNQSRIYQKIWSENYHTANCNDLDSGAKLTPDLGFNVTNTSFLFDERSFLLKSDPLTELNGINPAIEKFILPVGVIVLKDTKSAAAPPLEIIAFTGKNEILDLKTPLNINITLLPPEYIKYNLYRFRKCYLILITLDANENSIHTSNCLCG